MVSSDEAAAVKKAETVPIRALRHDREPLPAGTDADAAVYQRGSERRRPPPPPAKLPERSGFGRASFTVRFRPPIE